MPYFNIVAETSENTVVAGYEPVKRKADSYQSEAELEKEFIRILSEQGYEYLLIHTEDDLIKNLRTKLEELNHYAFSDDEWDRFFKNSIANPNDHIVEKTRKIQEDNVQVLIRDDGSSKNITLIDKKQVHNNRLQVINQYEVKQEDGARHDNRYDVTVLVNGFPLVHIELKRRGVPIREAFNQINRYQRDSFWTGSGLFEYVQIFVISNGTNTKYYSNSTRFNAIKDANSRNTRKEKTSNSFEFTSFWADADNHIIPDLIDFTKTFFAKHSLLNIITKYCVFTAEDMLLVMRPYQITATERILNRIEIANNYKKYGTIAGGGYIWHTTGSGKTLTSFKTARLASQLDYVDKVLFVVDRKDLDYQTMKEYDRFEKGCANSNSNTNILKKQLEDLVSQMKNGEKGKPLHQRISNMIRENELFRKSLNEFISEAGSMSSREKQLLNEINQLIDQNIRDMANYSVSGQLINRNNLIYNKLLMSEKASKEKEDFEDKRKSESATQTRFHRPEQMFEFQKKSAFIKTDIQKSDLKLNTYFKSMYNHYYIKLGNE